MRTTRRVPFISVLTYAVALLAITPAQAAFNSWTRSGGSTWQDNSAWSLGRCPTNDGSNFDTVYITNAVSKTVEIDDQTASKDGYSMSVSRFTLGAPTGATNTLLLINAGLSSPLRFMSSSDILPGGFLNVTNSALAGFSPGSPDLYVNGNFALNNSLMTNRLNRLYVGNSGNGQMSANRSTLATVWGTIIGNTTDDVGVVTFNNGTWSGQDFELGVHGTGQLSWSNVTATIVGGFYVAEYAGSTGTVSLSGTNIISVNSMVVGGSHETNLFLSTKAVGTIAVCGGATTISVGNGGEINLGGQRDNRLGQYQAGIGILTVTRGRLTTPNGMNIGYGGFGQATVASNSTLDVKSLTVGSYCDAAMTVSNGSLVRVENDFQIGGSDSTLFTINSSTCTVWGSGILDVGTGATGTVTDSRISIAAASDSVVGGGGIFTLLNSSLDSYGLYLGEYDDGIGTLILSNSTFNCGSDGLFFGGHAGSTGGALQATDSRLISTNGMLCIPWSGRSGVMAVTNCIMQWRLASIGDDNLGTLTMVGGTNTISDYMMIGYTSASTGSVTVVGGLLAVTNALSLFGSGKASLMVSNATVQAGSLEVTAARGVFTFESGTVTVNSFLADNGVAGSVVFNGGTLNTKASTVSVGSQFTVGNGTRAAALNLQGGTHSFANGLNIATNAQLRGTGTVAAALVSSGSVAPGSSAGTLSISGNYTQNAGGILNIDLDSAGSYDVLGVGGTAQLGGTLNVTNHYSPAPGDTFTFLTAANRAGTFAATNLPSPGLGSKWVLTYTPSAVILSLQTTLPVVTITNSNASVAYETTAYTIGGTNNANVVGTMRWTNTLTGVSSTFAAVSPWSIADILLNVGTNAIVVTGTNVEGVASTDSVQIIRLPVGSGTPVVDVLTENATAGYIATAFAIRGTNNLHVVGTMRWTNSLTGGNGTLAAASSWAVQGIGLGVGTNVLTVSGTNAAGATSIDAVAVIRLPAGPPTAGYGKALDFDGANDFVFAPALNWAPTEFTVEWWMNPRTRKNFNQSLSAGAGWGAFTFHTTTNGGIYVGTDGSDAHRMTPVELPAGTLETNTWQHFAFTFVGGTGRFYKDGTLVATKSGMSNSVAWGGFYISSASAASAIDGQVDEVRIWKTALPQATISNWMYRELDLTHPASDSLKTYYKFNEGSNAVANDAMGAYDGALSNMNTGICWVNSTVRDWRTWVNHTLDGRLIGSYEGGTSTDGTNGNLTVQIVGQGTVGTVQATAAQGFLFTPSPYQIGTNIFTYHVITTNGMTSTVASASVIVPSDYDADGILDPWEVAYYGGVTNVNPDAMASNNVNTVREAYIADLNPTNPASSFRIVAATSLPSLRVFFLSSSNRHYTLNRSTNLVWGVWTNVPGQGPRVGAGGPDWMQDTNALPAGFYRLDVRLP